MSIGLTLKAAREKAGLSREAVADQLRMRKSMLDWIEADQFEKCGGAVYARGYIRSIARIVGVDDAPLIKEFDANFGDPVESLTDAMNDGPSLLTPEKKLPWNTIVTVAAGLLLVIAGISVFNGSEQSPVAGPSSSPSQTQTETKSPSPSESAIAQAPGTVAFVVTASTGSSWLSVTNSAGESLHQGIIRRGTTLNFQDGARLKVVIGNAGAVTMKVNGKELGTPGVDGEVLHLEFTPND